MVGYNYPAAIDLMKQQVIMAAHIADISLQMPFAYNEIIFGRQAVLSPVQKTGFP
jgi:hypothetical protein